MSAHQVSESWSFDLAAVGSAGAVGHQINAKLPLRAAHKRAAVSHNGAAKLASKKLERMKRVCRPTFGASTAVYVAPGGTW